VIDSRESGEGDSIRRRRECMACGARFTTYERLEEILPLVIKKDGRREPYDRKKILQGLNRACEKRPVSIESLEALVSRVEKHIQSLGCKEVDSAVIGEALMEELSRLDPVAYVRFASVYRSFKDVNQFLGELHSLLKERNERGS
jgi:transcriptional repressor NrdR